MAISAPAPRTVLDRIGKTALLPLRRLGPRNGSRILLKQEDGNPTGSIKDRMALAMIETAEADGRLQPGGRVVEYTGGSTGVSLALICAVKGYHLDIVSSDEFAVDKLAHMRALGAEVHVIASDRGRMTEKLTRDMIEAARVIMADNGGFWTDQLNATAGLTEMLLQSRLGTIDVLPAPPSGWRSGRVDGLRAQGGFTIGTTWKSGTATEIRVASDATTTAKLRSDLFEGKVAVYRANGKPADYSVNGEVLTLPARAGEDYRIVAQAGVSLDAPADVQGPGADVPVSVTLTAADRTVVPTTFTNVELPDGWSADPASVKTRPLQPGQATTIGFTVHVPDDASDGQYRLDASVSTDEWTVRATARLEVRRLNHALDKAAAQSSLSSGGVAPRAVDGNTNGIWRDGSVTHTAVQSQPWWQVDLGASTAIEEIAVWNRTDCCADRLSNYYVFVSDAPFTSDSVLETLQQPGVMAYHSEPTAGTPTRVPVDAPGRYVRVQLTANSNPLSLAEVQVFGP